MIDTSEAAEHMENTDATDPIDPIESADPTEPIDNTEPREPIDSTECSEKSDHFEVPLGAVIGRLGLPSGLAGWVLDEREDAACHEPGAAHGFAGTGHLGDLDDPPPGRDLDPSTRPCGKDLIRPRAVVRGDDDLHAIAFHHSSLPPSLERPACTWHSPTRAAGQDCAWSSSAEGTTIGPSGGCVNRSGFPKGSRSAQSVP
jgi:hypothetical protein